MNRIYLSAFLLLISSVAAYAQAEWQSAIPNGLAWKAEPRLTTFSTSLSGLKTSNLTSESYDNKKNNKVGYLSTYLTQQISLDRPCEITFTVRNTNNYITGPQTHITGTKKKVKAGRVVANIFQTILLPAFGWGSWFWNPARETIQYGYKDNTPSQVYWGYTITVKSVKGSTTTFYQRFCHHDGYSVDEMSSDNNHWHSTYGNYGTENIKLIYDRDKTLKLYSDNNLVKTFPDATAITYLGLDAGCNAKLETSNFTIQRMTNYGTAKPMIEEATAMMQQENWYGASKLLGEVIDKVGYHDFKTYYLKGYCQMAQNNPRTAIEELTKAINFPSTTMSEREGAYYLRGYCKAQLEDADCVNDMRKAGEDGKIWLKEMQLEDYYPNQSIVKEVQTSPKTVNRTQRSLSTSKKPPLKK